jgi:type IV pilus assembly protein PilC
MAETATWSWEARDVGGRLVRGTLAAASASEVAARLRAEGRVVLGIERAIGGSASATRTAGRARGRRVRPVMIAGVFRRLSVMVESGVPLVEALEIESADAGREGPGAELAEIRQEVEGGAPFSEALSRHPRLFPSIAIGLVRAAEEVGDMSGMLERLSDWMQREDRLRRQVRTALAYPMLLASVGTIVTLLIVTLVMPRFEAIYAQKQAELPPLTEAVLGVGRFLTQGWPVWMPGLVAVIVGGLAFLRTTAGRVLVERARFELPLVRSITRPADLARATRTLAVLLASGVPILDAIGICRALSPWRCWSRFWDGIETSVRDGHGLSEKFHSEGLVPTSARAMVSAGERAGRLPDVLHRVADAADEDLEIAVKRVGVMLEPAAILILGSVIAVVAIALLLPVFKMSAVVGG